MEVKSGIQFNQWQLEQLLYLFTVYKLSVDKSNA